MAAEVGDVAVDENDTSPVATASERHIASPLPRTGPAEGTRSFSETTSAPASVRSGRGAVGGVGVDHQDLVDQAARRTSSTEFGHRLARSCRR